MQFIVECYLNRISSYPAHSILYLELRSFTSFLVFFSSKITKPLSAPDTLIYVRQLLFCLDRIDEKPVNHSLYWRLITTEVKKARP